MFSNKRGGITRQIILVCALLITGSSASATTLPYKSWNDLMNEADGVVMGTVRDIQSVSAERDVYSFVTLTGLTVLAGEYRDSELTLRFKGGMADKAGLHLVGSPDFAPGERVILFVRDNGSYSVPLVGWGQGVFRLKQDPASGRESISDDNGNNIFSISKGHVIKEQRHSGDARILGAPSVVNRGHGNGKGEAGVSDNGDPARELKDTGPSGQPMSLGEFIGAIKRDSQGQAVAKRSITSMTPGKLPAAGPTQDNGDSSKTDRSAPPAPALPERHGVPATPADSQR